MLSPFARPLRTAVSTAKGLRVNCAKHLLFPHEQKQILPFAQDDTVDGYNLNPSRDGRFKSSNRRHLILSHSNFFCPASRNR